MRVADIPSNIHKGDWKVTEMAKLLEAMFDAVEFRLAKRAFRQSIVRARRERRRRIQRVGSTVRDE